MDKQKLKTAIEAKKNKRPPDFESLDSSARRVVDLLQMLEARAREEFKGDKGDQGDPPSDQALLALIRPLIPRPIKGDSGISPSKEQLVALIKPLIPAPLASNIPGPKGDKGDSIKGDPGENAIELSIESIAKKLNSLSGEEKLSIKAIGGLSEQLSGLQRAIRDNNRDRTRHGGGGGGDVLDYKDISDLLDGSTKSFTITSVRRIKKIHNITSSSAPIIFRPTIDFTFTGTQVTFTAAVDAPSMLASGQSVIISYTY